MGQGLQVLTETGQVIFDSALCKGGVCAGIIGIPAAGGVFQFAADFAGRRQKVIFADSNKRNYSYSEPNGVPSFSFTASQGTRTTFAGVFFS